MKIFFGLAILSFAFMAFAQSPTTERDYTFQAVSTEGTDGTLSITANSPRPLLQALEVFYSKYGVEVDYEDPHYPNSEMYGPPRVGRRLKGGKFTATVRLQRPSSTAQNLPTNMIESLVKQYNDASPIKFEVHSHKPGERIDVIPAKSYQQALLNTPVVIEGKDLSVEDVINTTLQQVAKVSGQCIERGGLADNSLIAQKALTATGAVQAREMLAQVLDEMETKRIWLLTYEPQSSCFVFGVFHVQEAVDAHSRLVPRREKGLP